MVAAKLDGSLIVISEGDSEIIIRKYTISNKIVFNISSYEQSEQKFSILLAPEEVEQIVSALTTSKNL